MADLIETGDDSRTETVGRKRVHEAQRFVQMSSSSPGTSPEASPKRQKLDTEQDFISLKGTAEEDSSEDSLVDNIIVGEPQTTTAAQDVGAAKSNELRKTKKSSKQQLAQVKVFEEKCARSKLEMPLTKFNVPVQLEHSTLVIFEAKVPNFTGTTRNSKRPAQQRRLRADLCQHLATFAWNGLVALWPHAEQNIDDNDRFRWLLLYEDSTKANAALGRLRKSKCTSAKESVTVDAFKPQSAEASRANTDALDLSLNDQNWIKRNGKTEESKWLGSKRKNIVWSWLRSQPSRLEHYEGFSQEALAATARPSTNSGPGDVSVHSKSYPASRSPIHEIEEGEVNDLMIVDAPAPEPKGRTNNAGSQVQSAGEKSPTTVVISSSIEASTVSQGSSSGITRRGSLEIVAYGAGSDAGTKDTAADVPGTSLQLVEQPITTGVAIVDEEALSRQLQADSSDLVHGITGRSKVSQLSELELELQARYWGLVDDDDTVRCTICALQGHMPEVCPSRVCRHCGTVDEHFSNACPTMQKCPKCRERGHTREQCSSKLARSAADGFSCDWCHQQGHTEEDCALLWRTFNPDDIPNLKKVRNLLVSCYQCGSNLHWGDDCPMRPRKTKISSDVFSAKEANHYLLGPQNINTSSSVGLSIKGRAENATNQFITADDSEDDSVVFYGRKVERAAPPRGNIHVNIASAANQPTTRGPAYRDDHSYRPTNEYPPPRHYDLPRSQETYYQRARSRSPERSYAIRDDYRHRDTQQRGWQPPLPKERPPPLPVDPPESYANGRGRGWGPPPSLAPQGAGPRGSSSKKKNRRR